MLINRIDNKVGTLLCIADNKYNIHDGDYD